MHAFEFHWRKSYGSRTTWGRVNDDRTFIFGGLAQCHGDLSWLALYRTFFANYATPSLISMSDICSGWRWRCSEQQSLFSFAVDCKQTALASTNTSHVSLARILTVGLSAVDQNFIIEMNLQVSRFPSGSDSHLRPSPNFSSSREHWTFGLSVISLVNSNYLVLHKFTPCIAKTSLNPCSHWPGFQKRVIVPICTEESLSFVTGWAEWKIFGWSEGRARFKYSTHLSFSMQTGAGLFLVL